MEFIKRDARKLKRVGMSWRKPRGRKNKTKVGKRGHRKMPSKGFRSPISERYRIGGKLPMVIHSLSELDMVGLDNNVIIAGSVGAFKRAKILDACKSKNIKVVNGERNAENPAKTGK
ncbi:MAG: hypothetical protein M1433_00120 [Candidatus Parvarchaeota archaeon]|nr:hypothetical protein [Candidatus Parvarchaeota archaeon]